MENGIVKIFYKRKITVHFIMGGIFSFRWWHQNILGALESEREHSEREQRS